MLDLFNLLVSNKKEKKAIEILKIAVSLKHKTISKTRLNQETLNLQFWDTRKDLTDENRILITNMLKEFNHNKNLIIAVESNMLIASILANLLNEKHRRKSIKEKAWELLETKQLNNFNILTDLNNGVKYLEENEYVVKEVTEKGIYLVPTEKFLQGLRCIY